MGYTVSRHASGVKDAAYEVYARLLRQRGIDLGKSPRAPDPRTGLRWLYVWTDRAQAESFAAELRKRTRDPAWTVIEVCSPPSHGPMGPIVVQVGRRSTGLVFALHPLSRVLIQSAYAGKKPMADTISVNFQTLQDFTTTHGSIEELAAEIVPTLTGLDATDLDRLGYALIEDDTARTLVYVPPGDLVQAGAVPGSASST